jgi:ribosomal protein S18 acetylase RimI-like enzyme
VVEIRRIAENDAEAVVELWDQMCRTVPGGAPLTERGRRNLTRMLEMSAWHHEAFALVAVDGDRIVGFVTGELSAGSGLLPGLTGEIGELDVAPQAEPGLRRRLAEAAVSRLREAGAGPIFVFEDVDDADAPSFWAELGFEGDMVRFSLYSRPTGPEASDAVGSRLSSAGLSE